MNRREFVTCAICAGLASTVAKAGAFAEDSPDDNGPINVGGTQYVNREAFVSSGRRCGTPLPSLYDIRRTQRVRSALRSNNIDFNTKTVIPVHFHVIHDGAKGNLPDHQLDAQIAAAQPSLCAGDARVPKGRRRPHREREMVQSRHLDARGSDHEGRARAGHHRLAQFLHGGFARRPARLGDLPLVSVGLSGDGRRRHQPDVAAGVGPAIRPTISA